MKEIRHKERCSACKGTGLYVGMAERSGAAVVCHRCKGSGCFEYVHQYEPFEAREKRSDVLRVIQTNPGIVVGGGDLGRFGGQPYEDWRDGKSFPRGSEMREFTCPAWWYQGADYRRKPEWGACTFGRFSDCSYFRTKTGCWSRWDEENPTPGPEGGG